MMGYFMIRAYKSRLFKINIITFFYIIIFIYVVTIAIVHTFDVNRFITTINPFILITTFMALVYDMAWGLDGLRALMQKAQFRAFT